MAPNDLDEQVTKYLTDAHSIEQQALEQMKRAPDIAGDVANRLLCLTAHFVDDVAHRASAVR